MVKVATLKEQAREYERQGDIDKALAIYGHILTHLEGTPAIKGQLPLYVKVGDLHLKQGDTESAISMYERAADHYAEHGSAKSVIALCLKILRVAPKHTTVYLTYARRLLHHGHVSSARDVLTDFAERASLHKPLENLQRLRGRPDSEVRPMLERMLAGVRKPGEQGEEEPAPVGDPEGVPSAVATPAAEDREPSRGEPAVAGGRPPRADGPPRRMVPVTPRPEEIRRETVEETFFTSSAGVAASEHPVDDGLAAAPAKEDLSWMRHAATDAAPPSERAPSRPSPVRSARRAPSDRRPFEGFVRDAERRKATSRIWLVGALILILAAIGGAFVKLGVIPIELGPLSAPRTDPPVGSPPTPATEPQSAVVADSSKVDSALAPDNAVGLLPAADSGLVDSLPAAAAADTTAGGAPHETAVTPPASIPPVAARIDTLPARTPSAGAADARAAPRPDRERGAAISGGVRLPTGTSLQGPVVVIQGLAIDSVTEFPSGDLLGIRVIHLLDSGEPLILRAVPVGPAMGDTATSGAPRVTTLRGDTAFGTRVFAGYLVNAKGKVGSDRLDTLLRQLVRLEPDN